jgi:shikimate dehydrogenase
MIKACVIGSPIAHSRSPLIHGYWLNQLSIDGTYERILVDPLDLKYFLTHLSANRYAGCNVTLPHKENAVTLIDYPDQNVKEIGSLNTIYVRNGELWAESTDGEGFLQNVISTHPQFNFTDKKICIIGAGGSAKAIVERLFRANVKQINIINRSLLRAQDLQARYKKISKAFSQQQTTQAMKECDILINTTSLGMSGQAELDIDITELPSHAIVADIVYAPLKTKLIMRAEAQGLRTVPGLGMLLHQAVRGFELWFGQKPVVTPELYDLIAHDIDKDYKR